VYPRKSNLCALSSQAKLSLGFFVELFFFPHLSLSDENLNPRGHVATQQVHEQQRRQRD
jgi:hypothetical protein